MQDLLGMSGGEQALPTHCGVPTPAAPFRTGTATKQLFFFFFSTLFFFHYTKYWASSCVDVDPSPSFICILEQMLEVFSGEARCKRLYDGGTQSSPAGGILADASRRPTCACPSLTLWVVRKDLLAEIHKPNQSTFGLLCFQPHSYS